LAQSKPGYTNGQIGVERTLGVDRVDDAMDPAVFMM
jgi:hypothetical protein